MPDVRLSQLPEARPLVDDDVLWCEQARDDDGVVTRKVAISALVQRTTGAASAILAEVDALADQVDQRAADADASSATAEAAAASAASNAVATSADRATAAQASADALLARDQALAAATGQGLRYTTLALLNANLAPGPNAIASVDQDGNNNGTYLKIGASGTGSWTRISTATIPALDTRVSAIRSDLDNGVAVAYFSSDPDLLPDAVDANGWCVSWKTRAGVRVNPEATNLSLLDRRNVTPVPWFGSQYADVIQRSADGVVLAGLRVDGAFTLGPAPQRDYVPDVRGAVGARTVWLAGDGIAPVQLSTGEHPGDNYGAMLEAAGSVRWINVPPTGAPRIIRRSLLGDAPGMLAGVGTLVLLVGTGQSTSVGTASVNALTTTPPAPGRVLMFDNGSPRVLRHGHGPTRLLERVPEHHLRALVDAREGVHGTTGETQWTQAGYEMQRRLGDGYAVAVATVGIGSQPYSAIKLGTAPGDNLLEVVRATWLIAKLSGLAFRVVMAWPASEGDYTNSQAGFLAYLAEFQAQVTAAVNAATNGTGEVLLAVNGWANATGYGAATASEGYAQLQWAVDNPTRGVYGAPDYLWPRVADKIHRTAAGNALDGAYLGRAISRGLLGQDALPLYTTGVAVAGSTVTGTVHLPLGAVGLTGTSSQVTDPGQLGITCVRQDNGVAVPVASAAVVSGTTYQATLTSPPAGVPLWLEIGARGTPGNAGGPTSGMRSPLNDGHTDTSAYGVQLANHHAVQRVAVTF